MNAPDPKANTTTEAYLAYKAGYLEESELKPSLYEPYIHFDGWLAYWAGLTSDYPLDKNGDPEMLCDEEALVAYLSGVTDTYPEDIKDPYDVRIVGYLKYLVSYRFGRPEYPVNNEEFYLSTMDAPHTSNETPSADIELDTSEGKLIDVKAYGDTFQQTYSGKNLIDFANTTVRSSYLSTYDKQDNSLTVTMTDTNKYASVNTDIFSCVSGETYTFSLKATKPTTSGAVPNVRLGKNDNVPANIISYATPTLDGDIYKISLTFTADSNFTLNVSYYPNYDDTTIAETTFYDVQLEKGSQVSDYEPYVGGTASPNPDYPQNIDVVTGEQTVNVHGKNLFDKNNYNSFAGYFTGSDTIATGSPARNIIVWLACKPSTTYSFRLAPTTYSIVTKVASSDVIPGSGTAVSNIVRTTADSLNNYTTSSTANYLVLYLQKPSDSTYMTDLIAELVPYIQIEQGSTTTSYEPYQGQDYTVNLGSIELAKIGDYQDYIYKSGDDWYVHKAVGKAVLDGSENWTSRTDTYNVLQMDVVATTDNIASGTQLCNYAIYNSAVFNYGRVGQFAILTNTKHIIIGVPDGTTVASFQTMLSTNNLVAYYPLATATDTQITDSTLIGQLNALAGADTYNEKTYIKVTANDPNLPALLKVEAYKY